MYIQLVSIHGLVRGSEIEMGRDADTGGQVRYVVEMAKTLAQFEGVEQVDLFTRKIKDKRVADVYNEEFEELGDNVRIVRLPCGPARYIRKERLWPHLEEFIDNMISFTRHEGRMPAIVHGHYSDAGYVARQVASVFDVPFVFTGHSLGKQKLEYLLEQGWTEESADKEYWIHKRIESEEECLSVADLVITSTRHERDNQWGAYEPGEDQYFEVIPPGTDLQRFFPYYEYDLNGSEIDERYKQGRVQMQYELNRFFFNTDKPLILSLCRPERRKNIGALIRAYGECKELQAIANLAIFAGIRDNIEEMPEGEQKVLTDILLMLDRYDLYGKMAVPKWHDSEFEVPELYRWAAAGNGVFVNVAFTELFGLTAIESAATGLPFVATENGGPQDIVENTKSGLLVNVNDQDAVIDAIKRMITDHELWQECSTNGINLVREHYSWETHCEKYMEAVKSLVTAADATRSAPSRIGTGKRMGDIDRLLISDIDGTLIGNDDAFWQLKEILEAHRGKLGFGIASGRSIELVTDVLGDKGLAIDVIISSVGSEIHYGVGGKFVIDKGYASQLRAKWYPDRIHQALDDFDFLTLQSGENTQREFKISYDMSDEVDAEESLKQIHEALRHVKAPVQLIFSHGVYLDILPYKASKGKAVRYLSGKWNIPIEKIATAGDSGNDRDMLLGQTAAIVVGNYESELESLKKSRSSRVYFASGHCAAGIIEGLEHYGLIESGEPVAAS